jgi:hypothetical protein
LPSGSGMATISISPIPPTFTEESKEFFDPNYKPPLPDRRWDGSGGLSLGKEPSELCPRGVGAVLGRDHS